MLLCASVLSCGGGDEKSRDIGPGSHLDGGLDSRMDSDPMPDSAVDTGLTDLLSIDQLPRDPDSSAEDLAQRETLSDLDGGAGDLEEPGDLDLQADTWEGCAPLQTGVSPSSGYSMDGWQWEKLGVILEPDWEVAAMDGYLAPSLLKLDQGCLLYFTEKVGLDMRIMISMSDDCLNFSTPDPVGGIDGEYPNVMMVDGELLMWYGGGTIRMATSSGGMVFTPVENSEFWPGEAGNFDGLTVLQPSVIQEQGGYTMWYTGFDGATYRIGRAVSSSGMDWLRSPSFQVLDVGSSDSPDNRAVAQPWVMKQGSLYLMWYGAYDTSNTDPGPYRVALAVSEDGISWTRKGVSLELGEVGPDAYSTREPSVQGEPGDWLMAYAGMGDDLVYRIMLARSQACIE